LSERVVEELKQAIRSMNAEAAKKAAEEAVAQDIDLVATTRELSAVMREIGQRFSCLEIFLTELMMAGEAMKAITNVFAPVLKERKAAIPTNGKIVIGSVQGDIHDLGKNLVVAMLEAAGFEIHDLGVDIKPIAFINKAEEVRTNIIALSALMTTTTPFQKEAIDLLKELRLRDKYKIIIGGGAASAEWANDIGADAYGKDCDEAVSACMKLMGFTGQ
jgi:trimethylamine corrinoid protein